MYFPVEQRKLNNIPRHFYFLDNLRDCRLKMPEIPIIYSRTICIKCWFFPELLCNRVAANDAICFLCGKVMFGWETGIRTPIRWSRATRLTIRRSPSSARHCKKTANQIQELEFSQERMLSHFRIILKVWGSFSEFISTLLYKLWLNVVSVRHL